MLGTRASLGRTVRASHRGYVVITAGGCSAVAATQPIINAEAHEVACAVGVVVLCGTLAMFIYPALHAAVPALARHGLCFLTVCGFCLNLMWTHKIVSMAFSEKRRKWLRKDAEQ